jgi:hypothetical protein
MHHFGDQQIVTESKTIANGVNYVEKAIRKDLHEVSNEIIVKILGVIWFVAKRRTKYGREYMNIIHQYALIFEIKFFENQIVGIIFA